MIDALLQKTHLQKEKLTLENLSYKALVLQYTEEELQKDLGDGNDLTTLTLFSIDQSKEGYILAKEPGVLGGIQELRFFLPQIGIEAEFSKADGETFELGKITKLKGTIKNLLKAERVILNLLGRMSGVATLTKKFVEKATAENPDVLVTPTRKTLWGLLDKKACVLGGGGTHRLSLSDAIVIKHNHIRGFGSDVQLPLRKALNATFDAKGIRFVEVEVSHPREAREAIRIFADFKMKGYPLPCFVMFDNMPPNQIVDTLKNFGMPIPEVYFEASGGITLDNIQDYAKTGVHIISVGAITHSAPMLDFSFRIV